MRLAAKGCAKYKDGRAKLLAFFQRKSMLVNILLPVIAFLDAFYSFAAGSFQYQGTLHPRPASSTRPMRLSELTDSIVKEQPVRPRSDATAGRNTMRPVRHFPARHPACQEKFTH
jgi:hypothetical protein